MVAAMICGSGSPSRHPGGRDCCRRPRLQGSFHRRRGYRLLEKAERRLIGLQFPRHERARIGRRWTYLHREDAVAGLGQGWRAPAPCQQDHVAWLGYGLEFAPRLLAGSNERPRTASGPLLRIAGVHPPYAAEAFLFTPLRVATVFSLVFAAFSSLRFVVRRRTTSS